MLHVESINGMNGLCKDIAFTEREKIQFVESLSYLLKYKVK